MSIRLRMMTCLKTDSRDVGKPRFGCPSSRHRSDNFSRELRQKSLLSSKCFLLSKKELWFLHRGTDESDFKSSKIYKNHRVMESGEEIREK